MPKRIVAINDDSTFLDLMQELLTDEGYDARTFKEGVASHESVKVFRPDCIILDIRMASPETGWQVLELLKLDPDLTHVPVIICSADIVQLQLREDFLRAKGCEILPKPFDLNDLLEMLRRLIGDPD